MSLNLNLVAVPSEISASRKWWAMLGIGIGLFLFGLDVFIVNLALPTLVQELHTSFAAIQWVSLSYLLTLSVFMLGAGRLGDIYSKKSLYLGGLIVFIISSLLCGLAPSVGFLIGFRGLQGFGAVFIAALAAAMITEVFPEQERGRALGIINGIFNLGITLGATAGGLLIGFFNWRFIFLVNVPIGMIAGVIIVLAVPSSVGSQVKQGFDALGALIMTITLTCFVLSMTLVQTEGFGSLRELLVLAISVIGLACFLIVESRLSEPMLDLQIFYKLEFSLSLLLSLIMYIGLVGVSFILPFSLNLVMHYPAQQAGLLMGAIPAASTLIAPIAGILSDRFGERSISLIGLILASGGCLTISTCDTQATWVGYVVGIVLYGLGVGVFISSNNSAVMGTAPKERLGIASGLLSLSRTMGQTTGLAIMGVLFSMLTMSHAQLAPNLDITEAPVEALVFGGQMIFRVIALIFTATGILVALLWWWEQSLANNSVLLHKDPLRLP